MKAWRRLWVVATSAVVLPAAALASPAAPDATAAAPADATAPADPAPADAAPASPNAPAADLNVHHQPPKLKMRTAAAKREAAVQKPAEAQSQDGAPAGGADQQTDKAPFKPEAPETTGFTALPHSTRDLAERVTFRIRAGVQLDDAPASGETLRGGQALPPGFSDSRPWILGDAMVGARDILLPSLGGYFLSSFQFDASDAIADRTALVVPGDATDQRIAIKAGYAEYGNDERHPDSLWIRAGRQFRLDGGSMFAYFDGATIGYRTKGIDLSGFVGQRVVLYVDSTPGIEFGATAAVNLKDLANVPAKIAVDYLGLSISQPNTAPMTTGDVNQLRTMIALTGTTEPSKTFRLDVRARFVDTGLDGSSLTLGRVGGRLKLSPNDKLVLIADVEQRQSGDLAYDLAAPSAVDVIDISRKLGVGIGAPINAVTVGGRVDYRYGGLEVLAFGRGEITEQTPTTVDQEGWLEGGGAIAGELFKGAWLTAQYTGRKYTLEKDANLLGSAFDDTAGSGLARLHELSADATLRSQGKGDTRWRLGVGGFYRIYDLVTPYVAADHDGRGGGRLELQWWFTKTLHVDAAAELAQSSPILEREIGAMSSIRGSLEARW